MGPSRLVELNQVLKILPVVPEYFALFYINFLFLDIISQSFSKFESHCAGAYEGFYSLPGGYTGGAGDERTKVEHDLI